MAAMMTAWMVARLTGPTADPTGCGVFAE